MFAFRTFAVIAAIDQKLQLMLRNSYGCAANFVIYSSISRTHLSWGTTLTGWPYHRMQGPYKGLWWGAWGVSVGGGGGGVGLVCGWGSS